jgi:hypothetical protein
MLQYEYVNKEVMGYEKDLEAMIEIKHAAVSHFLAPTDVARLLHPNS